MKSASMYLDANVATNAQILGNVGNGAGWLHADALLAWTFEKRSDQRTNARISTKVSGRG